jgi:hypothetical protein
MRIFGFMIEQKLENTPRKEKKDITPQKEEYKKRNTDELM